MQTDTGLNFTVHDDVVPEEATLIDTGLDTSNAEAAPLEDVKALAAFARQPDGTIIGGAVGRTWGKCCELRQLWVAPEYRGGGVGSRLVQEFERRAIERGCCTAYLETFSFQARPFYESLGYTVALEIHGFTNGISKYTMTRNLCVR